MKLEPRGKYQGVKIHLDHGEVLAVIGNSTSAFQALVHDLRVSVSETVKDHPELLAVRTPQQIKEALEHERDSAIRKLQKLASGQEHNV